MIQSPRLTIIMPTYNQELYIREAVDSVLMQKTNFPYQLIIVDDKSTDRSLEIANDYQQKHPDNIRVIALEKNKGCLNATIKGYEEAKSDYLCVLDPDDYWTDPNLLQDAIDFLDRHPEYTMHVSNTYIKENDAKRLYYIILHDKTCEFNDINTVWGHTSGTVFRNVVFKHEVPKYLYKEVGATKEKVFEGDSYRNVLHSMHGKIYLVPKVKSVYRITGTGLWTQYNAFQKHLLNLRFFLEMFRLFDKAPARFFMLHIINICKAILTMIKNSSGQDIIPAKDLADFYKLLKTYMRSRDPRVAGIKELHDIFIFYLPSRLSKEHELLLTRLAIFLTETMGCKVYCVDHANSLADTSLKETKVKFIDYKQKNTIQNIIDEPFNLIVPIQLIYDVLQLGIKQEIKLALWYQHSRISKWLSYLSKFTGQATEKFLFSNGDINRPLAALLLFIADSDQVRLNSVFNVFVYLVKKVLRKIKREVRNNLKKIIGRA